jgi:hypothetical protein
MAQVQSLKSGFVAPFVATKVSPSMSVAVQTPLKAIGAPCADNNSVALQSATFSAGKFDADGFSIQNS